MAWSASKVFAYYVLQMGQNTVKPSTDGMKIALYKSNTMTPTNGVTTAAATTYNGATSQWVTANESTGTNYVAGGKTITSPSWAQSTTNVALKGTTAVTWTTVTVTTYGALIYDKTKSNKGVCYMYWGGVQTVTANNLTVTFNTTGIVKIAC